MIIKSTKSAWIDVDNTLVYSVTECPELYGKNIPTVVINGKEWYYNQKHIDIIYDFKSRGHTVVVWSAGGAEWAEMVVKALQIEHKVDLIISKPDYLFDDKPVTFWITPNMIYYKEP